MESAPFKLLGFKCGSGDWRAGEDTRPYGGSWKLPLAWAGCTCHEGTLIRLAYRPATFPLGGGRLSGDRKGRPYGGKRAGSLAKKT